MAKMGGVNEDRMKRTGAVRLRAVDREKSVLNKNMGTSLRAMDREYAELKKKQSELMLQKSTTNYLGEASIVASRRSIRGPSNRSNLAATSNRQLQQKYSRTEELPGGTTGQKPTQYLSKPQEQKPGTSGKTPIQTPAPTPDPSKKGKGKGKTSVSDQPTSKGSNHNSAAAPKSDTPRPLESSQRRGSVIQAEVGKHMRRGSRRESISGQTFTREEMEEQQRILDLFINLVEQVDNYIFDPAELSAKIKELAAEHKQSGGGTISRATESQRTAAIPHLQRLHQDPNLMKELQAMLNLRQSTDLGKRVSISSNSGSVANMQHNRKRRVSGLDMLSDILGAYKTQYKEVNFDPLAMLNCGYLRLSKSNVKELERLCREQGIEPGIHVHSDVQGFNVFAKDGEGNEGKKDRR